MQAGGRRFDPVRLHQGLGHYHGGFSDRVPWERHEARMRRCGFVGSGIQVFFGQVKRLVRFWLHRDAGWSDPVGEALRLVCCFMRGGMRSEACVYIERSVAGSDGLALQGHWFMA